MTNIENTNRVFKFNTLTIGDSQPVFLHSLVELKIKPSQLLKPMLQNLLRSYGKSDAGLVSELEEHLTAHLGDLQNHYPDLTGST